MSFEHQINITAEEFDEIESTVEKRVVHKGAVKYASMTSVVQLVHRMLGGLESNLELNEFEFDDDEITSS